MFQAYVLEEKREREREDLACRFLPNIKRIRYYIRQKYGIQMRQPLILVKFRPKHVPQYAEVLRCEIAI